MKNNKITLPDNKKVKINGEVFTIQKRDVDIFVMVNELGEEFGAIKNSAVNNGDLIKSVYCTIEKIIGYIDRILGEGSAEKIIKGKPAELSTMLEIMRIICDAVMESYSKNIADNYEGFDTNKEISEGQI